MAHISTATHTTDAAIDGIVQMGDPVLHTPASPVLISEITSPHIQGIIAKMKKILAAQADGVGLAAPQIGVSLQIFIVSGKVLLPPDKQAEFISDKKKSSKATKIELPPDLVFINPRITKFSKERKLMEGEGCLSVRWLYGKVERSTKVTLEAYDEHGKKVHRGAGGLLAHIFQHEVDHLGGILFIDKAIDVEELPEKDRPTT